MNTTMMYNATKIFNFVAKLLQCPSKETNERIDTQNKITGRFRGLLSP